MGLLQMIAEVHGLVTPLLTQQKDEDTAAPVKPLTKQLPGKQMAMFYIRREGGLGLVEEKEEKRTRPRDRDNVSFPPSEFRRKSSHTGKGRPDPPPLNSDASNHCSIRNKVS